MSRYNEERPRQSGRGPLCVYRGKTDTRLIQSPPFIHAGGFYAVDAPVRSGNGDPGGCGSHGLQQFDLRRGQWRLHPDRDAGLHDQHRILSDSAHRAPWDNREMDERGRLHPHRHERRRLRRDVRPVGWRRRDRVAPVQHRGYVQLPLHHPQYHAWGNRRQLTGAGSRGLPGGFRSGSLGFRHERPPGPMNLWRAAAELVRAGATGALATVARTAGSTPVPAGTKMLVGGEGRLHGTVGGGCVEADVIQAALDAQAAGAPALVTHHLNADLAGDLGLSCGGTVEIFVEPLVADPRYTGALEQAGAAEGEAGGSVTTAGSGADGAFNRFQPPAPRASSAGAPPPPSPGPPLRSTRASR